MMPIKKVQKFTAWSYSRLTDWEACPARAKYKHLDKLPEPPAPAMERGSKIHKLAEDWALGRLSRLPKDLKLFAEEFEWLRKNRSALVVEQQLGLDAKWGLADWFGPQTWVRIVMDCMVDASDSVRRVIDYKTGKVRPSHKEQLDLYAIGAFATAPKNINSVSCELWYLDEGEMVTSSRLRGDVPKLQKTWAKRAAPMLKDEVFKPTPGDACRWCPFTKAKSGPCKF